MPINNDVSRAGLERLWRALNDHSIAICGEWIVREHVGLEAPPAPSNDLIIKLATDYLKETI